MSSDESEVDETGVDPMHVRIIEIMMLGALPRSDAVQALIASGGDVAEACARFVVNGRRRRSTPSSTKLYSTARA